MLLNYVNAIFFGVGTFLGYWARRIIDSRQAEKNWKRKYYLEDLRKQRELLLEFLGSPITEFSDLHSIGHTWDEKWRMDKSYTINEWVKQYKPHFPEYVQEALRGIAGLAGSMVIEQGLELTQRIEGFETADKHLKIIKEYEVKLRQELK